MSQLPTVGRHVLYTLSGHDADTITVARKAAGPHLVQGNSVDEGQVYPATVVRTFGGDHVNLQVMLDGTDVYWATSRAEGTGPGTWSWPPQD